MLPYLVSHGLARGKSFSVFLFVSYINATAGYGPQGPYSNHAGYDAIAQPKEA